MVNQQGMRVACVDVPALPLQLVLKDQPDWSGAPVVVVEGDRPLARVLWLNRNARRVGIRPGMKLSQAQALSSALKAVVIPPHRVTATVDELFHELLGFSPLVEPVSGSPGLFWLDPNGLRPLFGSYHQWSGRLHRSLTDRGYVSSLVVGFCRYLIFAIARSMTGTMVLPNPVEERRLAGAVRLDRLDLSPTLFAELTMLGVDTLGQFLQLKRNQLMVRFGTEAAELHDLASGQTWRPLWAREVEVPCRVQCEVDPPDANQERILFIIKSMLQLPIDRLKSRHQAITLLKFLFRLDHAPLHREQIETAAPTLDLLLMMDLIRLRLYSVKLAAPVEQIEIELQTLRVHPLQLGLLQSGQRRDLEAAARAMSRIKAAFGIDSVTRARLRDAYLPEASFAWEPIGEARRPRPSSNPCLLPLVRRVFVDRQRLFSGPDIRLGKWGTVDRRFGPYRIAGGWWRRRAERDYFFVETRQGQILWLYYDRLRCCWVLQGALE